MFNRRMMLIAGVAASAPLPALAANTAEDFVRDNVQAGLAILSDKAL